MRKWRSWLACLALAVCVGGVLVAAVQSNPTTASPAAPAEMPFAAEVAAEPASTVPSAGAVTASDEALSAFVKIIVGDAWGSGVHIGDGYFLTAEHVVRGKKSADISIKTSDQRNRGAEILWSNATYDVALLRAEKVDGIDVATLDCSPVREGMRVTLHGNPADLEFVSIEGRFAGELRKMGNWEEALPFDGTIMGGMSGGAAVSADGDTVGIIVGVLNSGTIGNPPTGIGAIVPASTICAIMGPNY
jgi:S1-C subfamily serine protease